MVFALALLCATKIVAAQDTPLLSGGVAFFHSTSGGSTDFTPVIEPLLAAPIGQHLFIESRATLLETWLPKGNGQSGDDHIHFIGLNYLSGDFLINRHLTLVAGSYLVPFASYNERLSPIWINNFQDTPLIASLGVNTGTGLGGMARGSVVSHEKYSVDYTAFYSTRSNNLQFPADREFGGRVNLYLPVQRLEVGFSYDRVLQGVHENFYGVHVWWEPKDTALRLRSEFTSGQHADGYWVEADYRLQRFGGPDSVIGRFEPVFRMQQTFRRDNVASDGLLPVDVQRADFAIDYNLPHNTRILTSYGRQFASTGDHNVWETGIVYRFLFPAWRAKDK